MTKIMFRVFAALAIALTGSQTLLLAQGTNIEGTWNVSVTVVNCQTGGVIRTVSALQMYSHDGSFTETANTFLRGSSLGSWTHDQANVYTPNYWFYRYNPDGTFKSLAEGLNKVQLSADGSQFTAVGSITDTDANGNVLSIGCVTQTAHRLTAPHN